jgi:hypothetical protein
MTRTKSFNNYIPLCMALAVMVLAGCADVLAPQNAEQGLKITIANGETNPRTALPNPVFTRYELSFKGPAGASHANVSVNVNAGSVVINDLAAGRWTITATGYVTINGREYAAADGAQEITVQPGTPQNATITLLARQEGEKGSFSYSVNYPAAKVIFGTLEIYPFSGDGDRAECDLLTEKQGSISLSPGYYVMSIRLGDGIHMAGVTEIVHIYPNMATEGTYNFTEDKFIEALKVTNPSDDVIDGETLRWCIQHANSKPEDSIIIIDIEGTSPTITLTNSLEIKSNITIIAQKEVTIIRGGNATPGFTDSLFIIGTDDGSSSGKLTLGGNGSKPITIDGGKESPSPIIATAALITVNNGELVMNKGVTLQNNNNNASNNRSGGVYVQGGGTFTMNGGTISGNSSYSSGGGVYVDTNGTFTMKDGTIGDNSTGGNGGGVYVDGGTFTMSGGKISGNDASTDRGYGGGGVYVYTGGTFRMAGGTIYGYDDEDNKNICGSSASSAALSVIGGTAQYGTLNTDGTWKDIKGNLSLSDYTIKIVNGIRTFDVEDYDQWYTVRSEIGKSDGGVTNYYVINVTKDFEAGASNPTFGSAEYIDVTINGNGKTISLESNSDGSLLRINDGQTVTIENLNLQGKNGNDASLVYIGDNGTLTMKSGTISGNSSYADGGGVYVNGDVYTMSGGTFIMNGGTISGNSGVGGGGGVYVKSYGEFTMNGGTISGNSATSEGGGVYVYGTFNMTNGIIYGTEADTPLNNTAPNSGSAALCVQGTAQYGTLNANGEFKPHEPVADSYLQTTNNTIKVSGGNLESPASW